MHIILYNLFSDWSCVDILRNPKTTSLFLCLLDLPRHVTKCHNSTIFHVSADFSITL